MLLPLIAALALAEPGEEDVGPRELLAELARPAAAPVPVDATLPVGNEGGTWVVVQYTDLLCHECALAYGFLNLVAGDLPEMEVRYAPYPQSSECNPGIDEGTEDARCQLAEAVDCAHSQGKLRAMMDAVYGNQAPLRTSQDATASLMGLAVNAGIDGPELARCLTDPRTSRRVHAGAGAGAALGVTSSPTFFVWGPEGLGWTEVVGSVDAVLLVIEARKELYDSGHRPAYCEVNAGDPVLAIRAHDQEVLARGGGSVGVDGGSGRLLLPMDAPPPGLGATFRGSPSGHDLVATVRGRVQGPIAARHAEGEEWRVPLQPSSRGWLSVGGTKVRFAHEPAPAGDVAWTLCGPVPIR
jgi:protein-disulfide isomerase